MRTQRKKLPVNAKEGKCLAVVSECAQAGRDPSATAVALILRGDASVGEYGKMRTYGTLTSLSVKKIKTLLTLLQKKRLLASYSPSPYMERYLILTEKGEAIATQVLAKNIRKTVEKPAIPLFNERN